MKRIKQFPMVLLLTGMVALGLLGGGCRTTDGEQQTQTERLNAIQKQQIADLSRENELLRRQIINLQESNQEMKQTMPSAASEPASAASTPEIAEPVAVEQSGSETAAGTETVEEPATTEEAMSETTTAEAAAQPETAMEAAPASGEANIRIFSLIPNPSGNERREESVTLINKGTAPGSLVGWRLKDLTNNFWQLDAGGVIEPGQKVTVRRNGMNMGMNNTGDTIYLVNPDGETVQTVTYEELGDDEVVTVEE